MIYLEVNNKLDNNFEKIQLINSKKNKQKEIMAHNIICDFSNPTSILANHALNLIEMNF